MICDHEFSLVNDAPRDVYAAGTARHHFLNISANIHFVLFPCSFRGSVASCCLPWSFLINISLQDPPPEGKGLVFGICNITRDLVLPSCLAPSVILDGVTDCNGLNLYFSRSNDQTTQERRDSCRDVPSYVMGIIPGLTLPA